MKKILVVGILLALVLSGCGKVASNVQDLGDTYDNKSPISASPSEEKTTAQSFISGLKEIFSVQVSALGEIGTSQEVAAAQTSFNQSAGGFSVMAINYDDNYQFWKYQMTNKNMGSVREVIEGKYRYYDKRTGAPFTEAVTATNNQYVDYIERLERSTANYTDFPARPVFTTSYHEKITYDQNYAYVTLAPNKVSTMQYIGWNYGNLELTSLNIRYEQPANTNAIGYVRNQGVGSYSAYSFCLDVKIINGNTSATANVYYNNTKWMALIAMPGASNKIETLYYIGTNCFYTEIAAWFNSGTEDNATLELQDNSTVRAYPGFTMDGTKSGSTLTNRIQNLTIKSKDGIRARFNTPVTLINIDGVNLSNIDFAGGLVITECTNVVMQNITR